MGILNLLFGEEEKYNPYEFLDVYGLQGLVEPIKLRELKFNCKLYNHNIYSLSSTCGPHIVYKMEFNIQNGGKYNIKIILKDVDIDLTKKNIFKSLVDELRFKEALIDEFMPEIKEFKDLKRKENDLKLKLYSYNND